MESGRKDRRSNPFRVGLAGLVLLLIGCVAQQMLRSPASEGAVASRLQQAARAEGGRLDPATAETVARAERYYRAHRYGQLLAQVVFLVGVTLVVAAGITWYQQAQQPEPAGETDEEPEEERAAS